MHEKRQEENEPYQLRSNTLGKSTGSHENVSDSPWNKIQKPLTPMKASSGNMWILLHFIYRLCFISFKSHNHSFCKMLLSHLKLIGKTLLIKLNFKEVLKKPYIN